MCNRPVRRNLTSCRDEIGVAGWGGQRRVCGCGCHLWGAKSISQVGGSGELMVVGTWGVSRWRNKCPLEDGAWCLSPFSLLETSQRWRNSTWPPPSPDPGRPPLPQIFTVLSSSLSDIPAPSIQFTGKHWEVNLFLLCLFLSDSKRDPLGPILVNLSFSSSGELSKDGLDTGQSHCFCANGDAT